MADTLNPFVISGANVDLVIEDNDDEWTPDGENDEEFEGFVSLHIFDRNTETVEGVYLDRQETVDLVNDLLARLAA